MSESGNGDNNSPMGHYKTTKEVVVESVVEEAAAMATPKKSTYIVGLEPPLAREARLRIYRISKYGYDPLATSEQNTKKSHRNQSGGPIAAYMRRCEAENRAKRRQDYLNGTVSSGVVGAGAGAGAEGVATPLSPSGSSSSGLCDSPSSFSSQSWSGDFDESLTRSKASTEYDTDADTFEDDDFWDLTAWQRNKWQSPSTETHKQSRFNRKK